MKLFYDKMYLGAVTANRKISLADAVELASLEKPQITSEYDFHELDVNKVLLVPENLPHVVIYGKTGNTLATAKDSSEVRYLYEKEPLDNDIDFIIGRYTIENNGRTPEDEHLIKELKAHKIGYYIFDCGDCSYYFHIM